MSPRQYAESTRIVKKVRSYLEQLRDAKGNLLFRTSQPDKLARDIREAIAVCRKIEKEDFANLLDKYMLKCESGGVFAKLRAAPLDVIDLSEVTKEVEIQQTSDAVITDCKSILAIIQRVITSNATSLKFAYTVNLDDANKLTKWAESQSGKYHVTVGSSYVTVTKL